VISFPGIGSSFSRAGTGPARGDSTFQDAALWGNPLADFLDAGGGTVTSSPAGINYERKRRQTER
jgi:hypothetical protein